MLRGAGRRLLCRAGLPVARRALCAGAAGRAGASRAAAGAAGGRLLAAQLSAGLAVGVGLSIGVPRYAECEAARLQSLDTIYFGEPEPNGASSSSAVGAEALAERGGTIELVRRGLRCAARAAYLWAVLGPLLLARPVCRLVDAEEFWWRWCVRAFELSGALLIKLAQWASSRPDLFGESVCQRFKHLQDNTRPHAWEDTVRTLDSMFGPKWPEQLRLEPRVIGSGCIAQVYRGSLRLEGEAEWRPVAVKVLHPTVHDHINVDMDLLRSAGWLIECWPTARWLNPAGMLGEFAQLLLVQLDLRTEAENLLRFRRNFPEGPEQLVSFPEPLYPFVSSEAFVESFADGEPILKWAAKVPEDAKERRLKVCYKGIDAMALMMFEHNFIHGDLHPGNIFVTVDEQTGEDHMVFLDAGIAVSYSQADHQHLIDVLTAFIQYDGYYGGQLMAEHTENPDDLRDVAGFCSTIQDMVEMARDCPSFFDQLGECISIICRAACDHHVKMKASFISIALSVKVVEGAVIQVDRDAVVAPRAKPIVVREHMKRKGRAMLGRSLSTGFLLNNDKGEQEDALIKGARERAAAGLSNHPKHQREA